MVLKRASVRSTDLTVCLDRGNFWMIFSDDGAPNAQTQTTDPAMILASIRYRIRTLGGNVQISRTEASSTVLTVSMPLQEVVAG